jgi:hypothetical protein
MEKWVVRPATNKMLAALYGVSPNIITKHIHLMGDKIGTKIGNFWMMNQVITIIDHLGPPPNHELIYPTSNRK